MSGSSSDIFMSGLSPAPASPLGRIQRGRDRGDHPSASDQSMSSNRRRHNGTTPESMAACSRTSDASLTASVLSLGSTPSQAPRASQLGFDRGDEVKQPVVVSRLAKAVPLLPDGSPQRTKVVSFLSAVKDIEPSNTYWHREHPNTPLPAELHDQTIGTVTAHYADPPAMRNQRRYAIGPGVFGLGRMARAAGRYHFTPQHCAHHC
jgi:hypothetical protein